MTSQQKVLVEIFIRALQMVVNALKHYVQSNEVKQEKQEQISPP